MTALSLFGRVSGRSVAADGEPAGAAGRLGPAPSAIVSTTVSAALRAVAAVIAGLVLVSGAALVLWALTPGDGSDSAAAVRGGTVALAAAHFLPVSFSGAAVTVRPLLLTGLMVATVATSAGRARMVRGRLLEALHVSVFVLFYAVGMDVATAVFSPAGTVRAGLAGPLAVAAVGSLAALAFHATAWRQWWRSAVPSWLQEGARAATVTTLALLTAGAAAVAVGLAVGFPQVSAVAGLAVRSPGAALGMLLLCLVFLPNAAVAGIGYLTGAGFSVGAATFSPIAVHRADLPAIPLLAATPEHAASAVAWVVLIGPVLAAALAGRLIVRGTDTRRTRLAACAVAAVGAAVAVAALAAVSGGGVTGGAWSSAGAPALLTGALVAGITAVVTVAMAVSTGWRGLPWTDDAAVGDEGTDDTATGGDRRPDPPREPDAGGAETPEDSVTPDAPPDAAGGPDDGSGAADDDLAVVDDGFDAADDDLAGPDDDLDAADDDLAGPDDDPDAADGDTDGPGGRPDAGLADPG